MHDAEEHIRNVEGLMAFFEILSNQSHFPRLKPELIVGKAGEDKRVRSNVIVSGESTFPTTHTPS